MEKMKVGWTRLKRRPKTDKPVTPTPPPPAVLDSMQDGAHPGASTTSSGTQAVDMETQKSADAVENTGQEFHEESTEPASDQENKVPEPMVEPPTQMLQNALTLETAVYLEDQELFSDPSLPAVDSPTTLKTLWDEAYEILQRRQRRMVIWYETILSPNLEKKAPDQLRRRSSVETSILPFENMINQKDYRVRRAQMGELLERWLNETDEEEGLKIDDTDSSQAAPSLTDSIPTSNIEKSLESDDVEARQIVPSLRDVIRKTVEITPPEATLAWVSACYASKAFLHPNKDDCSGLIYVISRMEWYSRLPKVLAADADNDERHKEIRKRIVNLFGAILSYLMKMVCAHFGSLAFDFHSDIYYPRSRDRRLTTVTDAENALPLFNQDHVRLPLERLLEAAKKEQATSIHELEQLSEENSQLLSKLHIVDPRPGIFNLEIERSQAIHELYNVLLSTEQYKKFQDWDKPENQLLWISGSAGQGKTMLLTGIVRSLSGKTPTESDSPCLTFFFFDYRKPEADNAAAALKGLIWLLLVKQPFLSSHLAEKFSSTGRKCFDSPNDFLALSAVFYDMIQDIRLSETYFVVDGLDECSSDEERPGLDDLLLLITKSMKMSTKIRWLVSSNYSDSVESQFKGNGCLHLALNSNLQDSRVAIDNYIRCKVSELASVKSYDEELETIITNALQERSLGNYLWVNIVCTALEAEEIWYAASVLEEVKELNNLRLLYGHLVGNIAGLPRRDMEFCMDLLSTMAIVHESLHIDELKALVCLAPRVDLRSILQKCSSFLQVRDDVVSFLHQSVKDYLLNHVLEPSTISKAHSNLTQRCLDFLGNDLSKKSHATQDPRLDGATPDIPSTKGNYASLYWMTHLSEISNVTEDLEICKKVRWFLEEHFLYWVQDLVWRGQLSIVAAKLQKVDLCLAVNDNSKVDYSNTLQASIRDAHLFIRFHNSTDTPKDVHVHNTLLFFPKESIIRKAGMPKALPWVTAPPAKNQHWRRDFNAFQGHSDWIRSIAFSPDGRLIASGSDDSSVRIWDTEMGTTQHTLKIRRGWVYCVAFSSRGTVAAGSDDYSITLWDSATGHQLKQLPDHSGTVNAICFSEDGSKLAAASSWNVRIWDLDRLDAEADRYEFDDIEGHSDTVRSVVFSRNGQLLATGSDDAKIRVWDVETRELRSTLEGHTGMVNSVAFSSNMKLIGSGSDDGTSGIWDAESEAGQRLLTLESTRGRIVNSVTFSPDGLHLASATDNEIDIWDTKTGDRQQGLRAPSFSIRSVAFSPSGAYLASGSFDSAVHLWYATGRPEDGKPSKQLAEVYSVSEMAISPDGRLVAAAQSGGTVSLWDMDTNELLNPEMGFQHDGSVFSLMFSPSDGKMLLSSSSDGSVRVCVVDSGDLLHRLLGHTDWVRCATWSADGAYVASASDDSSIRIWRIGSKEDEHPTVLADAHGGSYATAVAFSPNGKYIISGGNDRKMVVWERKQDDTWERKHTLAGHLDNVVGVVVSPDCKRIVSSSVDNTLRIWDIEKEEYQPPIKIEWCYKKLWFDQRSSDYVMTAHGLLSLTPNCSSSQPPPWCPYRISYDEEEEQWWITWEDKKIIFLPEMFHPTSSRILGHRVVIGTNHGQIDVYSFSKDISPPSVID